MAVDQELFDKLGVDWSGLAAWSEDVTSKLTRRFDHLIVAHDNSPLGEAMVACIPGMRSVVIDEPLESDALQKKGYLSGYQQGLHSQPLRRK